MKIEVICPLYNAENYLINLHQSILKQKTEDEIVVNYVLTESTDNTEQLLIDNSLNYQKVKKEEFSHSLTREIMAKNSDADIIVFITQDVNIEREDWLNNLITPIKNKECHASFSRQVTKYKGIEQYIREKNYPEQSCIRSKEDLQTLGMKAFFFSDASSAIDAEVFKALNYYDGKKLVINEDMYIAYKLITNGYKIKYCADSVVVHSHKFTLKELYHRYYDTGIFMAENSYLDKFGTTKTGGGLAKYVLKRALKEFNIKALFRFIPDMMARWFGMRNGKKFVNKNLKRGNK